MIAEGPHMGIDACYHPGMTSGIPLIPGVGHAAVRRPEYCCRYPESNCIRRAVLCEVDHGILIIAGRLVLAAAENHSKDNCSAAVSCWNQP